MVIGIESTSANKINCPTSTPKIPQTPKGPGVGGTMVWVITRPAARATPKEIRDFFVTLEIAFAIGDRIIKPESQKIGIETRKPVKAKASSSLFFPNTFKKQRAIRFAAPVSSKIAPSITPKPIIIPILDKVFPNPLVIDCKIPNFVPFSKVMVFKGIPPITPITTVVIIRAKKA